MQTHQGMEEIRAVAVQNALGERGKGSGSSHLRICLSKSLDDFGWMAFVVGCLWWISNTCSTYLLLVLPKTHSIKFRACWWISEWLAISTSRFGDLATLSKRKQTISVDVGRFTESMRLTPSWHVDSAYLPQSRSMLRRGMLASATLCWQKNSLCTMCALILPMSG